MTPEAAFSIANLAALAGWAVLAAGVAMNRPLWRDGIAGLAVPLLLSAAYTLLILIFWWGAEGGFDSLANVRRLFASPWVALAGWLHYLAFDLAMGASLARRFAERGMARFPLLAVLPLTFLFGPIGYLLGRTLLAIPRTPRTVRS